MNFPEFGNPTPNPITTQRLTEARATIASVVAIDADTISSNLELATHLQGFSRAVTDIVLSQGTIEFTDLPQSATYDPATTPPIRAEYVLRRFHNPSSRYGRMFEAKPGIIEPTGALLAIRNVFTHNSERTLCEAQLPTDRVIDQILTNGPDSVDMVAAYFHDFRQSCPTFIHPFAGGLYPSNQPNAYLTGVQELSSELLELPGLPTA